MKSHSSLHWLSLAALRLLLVVSIANVVHGAHVATVHVAHAQPPRVEAITNRSTNSSVTTTNSTSASAPVVVSPASGASSVVASRTREVSSLIGVYLSGMGMLHNARFNAIDGCQTCRSNDFGAQLGFGGAAGLQFETALSSFISLQARAGGSFWTSLFNRDLTQSTALTPISSPTGMPPSPTITGRDEQTTFRTSLAAQMLSVGIEPAVVFSLTPNLPENTFAAKLRAELGAALTLPLTSSFEQKERIVAPSDAAFINANGSLSRERDVFTGRLGSASQLALQAAVFAGLSAQFALSETWFFQPFLRFYVPLTNIANTLRVVPQETSSGVTTVPGASASGSWQALTLQAGVAVNLGIRRPYPTDTRFQRDTTTVTTDSDADAVRLVSSESSVEMVEDYGLTVERTTVRERYVREISKRNTLALDLKVVGLGKDGDEQENPTIVVEEFESDQMLPLLPYLYFPEGKDSLRMTRQHLLSGQRAAERWSEGDIDPDQISVFSDLLNVLGSRMSRNAASRITLTGCNANTGSEQGDTALSRRRAESVARYLTSVWGIPRSRIITRAQNAPTKPARFDSQDGQEENRRVEIETSPAELLAPVRNDDVLTEVTPPTLELTPIITAPAGLNWWYMYVKQRGNLLKQFSGAEPVMQTWKFTQAAIDNMVGENEVPLTITLQAADKADRQGNISKDVTVRQVTVKKKRVEFRDDKRIDRFSFIMFDYDRSLVDADMVKRLIVQVKEKISPTSSVTIAGYGDRSGSREYNRDLAARRCAEVQRLLQVPDKQLTLKPVGNSALLQDNSVPEGRAYSRVVQITVETPIKPGTPVKPRKKTKEKK
jgi:outer membrane protein OmpA-like peptidoglycan-associated protein